MQTLCTDLTPVLSYLMGLFTRSPQPSTLDQDFIQRYWDLASHVDALEAQLDERLDELERRYKRAEQSERRLDQKRADEPCADVEAQEGRRQSVFDIARRAINESG